MTSYTSLADHFLIAMPDMTNPHFDHTVTYICEHNEEGAMGFVINRPIGITMGELYRQVEIDHLSAFRTLHEPVLSGGPVENERGFVLHTGAADWNASIPINNNLSVTTSLDILEAIGHDEGPETFRLILGYAGWESQQLESELLENTWLPGPADEQLLFHSDGIGCWHQAAQLIGIDIEQIHSQAGHA